MRMIFSAAVVIWAGAAAAQDWALRDGDAGLDRATLEERLRGRILTFYDDGQSEYYDDGRYTYTYANGGGTAYGYWEVREDGVVCIKFVNGFSRCDRYVQSGAGLVLLTEGGDRFPVRP